MVALISNAGIPVDQVISYGVGLLGFLFSLIIGLLVAIWNQNKVQFQRITEGLEKQLESIDSKLTSCREKDDNSHKSFHVSFDALRDTISKLKERMARIEEREKVAHQ